MKVTKYILFFGLNISFKQQQEGNEYLMDNISLLQLCPKNIWEHQKQRGKKQVFSNYHYKKYLVFSCPA